LDLLPAAIYTADRAARITYFNAAAAAPWGCRPELGRAEFRGTWKHLAPDGTPLAHDQCPMAQSSVQVEPSGSLPAACEAACTQTRGADCGERCGGIKSVIDFPMISAAE
jgi:hypothetical protein